MSCYTSSILCPSDDLQTLSFTKVLNNLVIFFITACAISIFTSLLHSFNILVLNSSAFYIDLFYSGTFLYISPNRSFHLPSSIYCSVIFFMSSFTCKKTTIQSENLIAFFPSTFGHNFNIL
eukprot:TRINITY_DN29852_c0_g1_i2.p2 TRINITY_DN29852_c0_g1~~TRINITY_DN29852_c0_g1_i2.p2  ORF type:complete len:121 (-),score=12.23 TRINITY_DN29852_c0_g1_i2:1010-1372(-)